MKASFEILEATRTLVLKTIENLSLEQINTVLPNFNNNIVWNVAHIVVTQQLLCYGLSYKELYVNDIFVNAYKKGTVPSGNITEKEWDEILELFKTLPQKLTSDYNNQNFKQFKKYPTSYGYELNSIENAIEFNNVHEALHLGYIMAMKKGLK